VTSKRNIDANCACGAKLGPWNHTGRCRQCSSQALLRPLPDDFATMAHTSDVALLKHYACSSNTLARWRVETGIPCPLPRQAAVPAPEGFSALAARMTRNQLRLHFSCSLDKIDRWCRETGARPINGRPAGGRAGPALTFVNRDYTRAGQAADYLRRFGPVVRCDAKGRFKQDGSHWRRGSTVLTAQEVIERAERQGWNPDAWRMVA
jgi:hypothetical protein